MKRAGFTMIELIFVIVILGILAAVALPKFAGVASQAQLGKTKAFVGTLNRTVGPGLWAEAVANTNGSVAKVTEVEMGNQIELPQNIGDTSTTDLKYAVAATPLKPCTAWKAPAAKGQYTDAEILLWKPMASVTINAIAYTVTCMDGSMSASPHFALIDKKTSKVLTK